MARPVDEKIVRMKLENSDFSRKASETVGIFGKLRDGLNKIPGVNLGKTTKEIAKIGDEVGKVPMVRLVSAVEQVASKFSVLGIMATTALRNIANRATDTGIKMVKALSTDGIVDGFREYELKMGSIQTILTNTAKHGTTLGDVNKKLNELNEYSDKTIYNFADMTKNIGLFTTSGMELDTSVTAIKGLSNWAAASGASATNASTAMYQLSQSLSSGVVRLQDWKSLENANMGGAIFRDALLDQAKAMGTVVDMSKGFNYSLEQNWLSTEVLMSVLDDFSKREDFLEAATKVRTFSQLIDTTKEAIGSGWAQTWEIVFGDFEDASTLFSSIADKLSGILGASADARNELLKGWEQKGGRAELLMGLKNIVVSFGAIGQVAKEAFREFFPAITVDRIVTMTQKFHDFTKSLKPNYYEMGKFKTIFKGAFSIIDSGIQIIKTIGKAFFDLMPSTDGLGTTVLDMAVNVAELAISFNESLRAGNSFTELIEKIGKKFKSFKEGLKGFKLFGDDTFKSKDVDKTTGFIDGLTRGLGALKEVLKQVATPVKEFFTSLTMTDALGIGALGGGALIAVKLAKVLGSIKDFLSSPGKIMGGIYKVFDNLGESLEAFTGRTKANSLLKIAISLGILAVSIKLLQGLEWADIGKGLGVLGVVLGGLVIAFGALAKVDITGFSGAKIAITLMSLAVATTIMASALNKFKDTDPQQLGVGIAAVASIMALLVFAMKGLSKSVKLISASDVAKISIGLIAMSISVALMAGAVKKLSEINSSSLLKGGLAIAGITAILVTTFAVLGKVKAPSAKSMASFILFTIGLQQAAVAMVIFGAALHILIPAVEKVGKMDIGVLTQGLIGVTVAIAGVGLAMKLAKGSFSGAVGLLVAVGAIHALLPVIEKFGSMPLQTLAIGMGAVGVSMGILVGALLLAKGGMVGAIALIAAAGAMNLLLVPILALSRLSIPQLVTALVALGGSIAIIGGLAAVLTPVIPAMLGMGAALALIGVSVVLAGAGLTLLATGLGVLVGVAVGSFAAIIMAMDGFITSLISLTPKLGLLAIALVATLANGLITNIPLIVQTAGTLILALLGGIVTYLPKILELGVNIILILVNGIITYVPVLVSAAVQVIISFINGLATALKDNGPKLIGAILGLIGEITIIVGQALIAVLDTFIGWIPGASKALGKASDGMAEIVRERFDGEALGKGMGGDLSKGLDNTAKTVEKSGKYLADSGEKGVGNMDLKKPAADKGQGFIDTLAGFEIPTFNTTSMLGDKGEAGLAGFDMASIAGLEGDELIAALTGKNGAVKAAGEGLGKSAESGVSTANLKPIGQQDGAEYASGVESKKGSANSAGRALADNAVSGSKNANGYPSGANFAQGFVNGIWDKVSRANTAALALANAARNSVNTRLEMRSPSRVMFRAGGFFGQGFVNGIAGTVKSAGQIAGDMAENALNATNNFIDKFANDFVKDNEYEFKLKPVVDMNNFGNFDDSTFGIKPDTSRAYYQMDQASSDRIRQNENKSKENIPSTSGESRIETTNQYEINITANGKLPRSTIKEMAQDFQTEIKKLNDDDKRSRGELVNY